VARHALFVMAKDPRVGQVKTRLCPPLTPEMAAGLYECFLLDVLDLVAELPGVDPVVAFSPPEARPEFSRLAGGRFRLISQEGADLGARLENAFRVLFAQGYERVAAVSTDSPDLPAEYLAEAFTRIEDARVVLGPCPDGGYYLIGLSRLIPELFRDMPWSTDRVVSETATRAKGMGLELSYLPAWHDVDTAADLTRLVGELTKVGRSGSRAPRTTIFCQRELQSFHQVEGRAVMRRRRRPQALQE
jgi:rSAM/selenodomain-associated transferase 1